MLFAARLTTIAMLADSAAAAKGTDDGEPYRANEFDAAWAALDTMPHVRAVQ